jgi:hypothetical protein
MLPRTIVFLTVALALSACGPSQPTEPRAPIAVRSPEQDRLHRLDDMNRAIALKRAIYASGFRCKRVERSGYVAEHENLSMWTAQCADKQNWAIFVGPDASVQVRRCEDVVRAGLPACTIKSGANSTNSQGKTS